MVKILLGVAVLVVGSVLWFRPPFLFESDESLGETDKDDGDGEIPPLLEPGKPQSPESSDEDRLPVSGAMLPLVDNAVWHFHVQDSRSKERERNWMMRIVRLPQVGTLGLIESGFEGHLTLGSLTDTDGDIRIDGIDFVSPPDFKDNVPVRFEGETLPRGVRLIEGAVWEFRIIRETTYRFENPKGSITEAAVHAKETHRAVAGKVEKVTVPKGRIDARRIDWVSRVEMTADGRPVLCPLTTKPYRKERMWVAPKIGFVKREITFIRESGVDTVTLELMDEPGH